MAKNFAGSLFQSTLPIREETPRVPRCLAALFYFNPLFPYGKRLVNGIRIHQAGNFNPLFPYGKRHDGEVGFHVDVAISIHSSHTGRDAKPAARDILSAISIHSSHTGRDRSCARRAGYYDKFQSTLPIREETSPLFSGRVRLVISIHSFHTGRDPAWLSLRGNDRHFNPLFPYGKRHPSEWLVPYRYYFNPLFPYGKRPDG